MRDREGETERERQKEREREGDGLWKVVRKTLPFVKMVAGYL